MMKNIFGASLLCLSLIACGGGEDAQDEETSPVTEAPEGSKEGASIEVTDPAMSADDPAFFPSDPTENGVDFTRVLGTFEGDVTGLAFSRNSTNPQDSTLLAANGTAGIALIPTSDGRTPSVHSTAGQNVVAIAATSVDENPLIAYEILSDSIGQISIAAFTEDRTDLAIVTTLNDLESTPAELCFTGSTLFRVADDKSVTRHQIGIEGGSMTLSSDPLPVPSALDCASAGDRVVLLLEDGSTNTVLPDGEMTESSLTLTATQELTVMPFTAQEIVFGVNEDGRVETGDQIFSFSIDGEPVEVAQLVAAPGNFGGVNRNGVMAALTTDNQLGLVSWLAVATALDLPRETDERIPFAPKPEAPELDLSAPQIDLPEPPASVAEPE